MERLVAALLIGNDVSSHPRHRFWRQTQAQRDLHARSETARAFPSTVPVVLPEKVADNEPPPQAWNAMMAGAEAIGIEHCEFEVPPRCAHGAISRGGRRRGARSSSG